MISQTFWCTLVFAAFVSPIRCTGDPEACLPGEEHQDYTQVSPEELGVRLLKADRDPSTGFLVAGRNETAVILALTSLNGRSIADLEREMRPGEASDAGFLGKQDSLLDVLAADNRFVVEDRRQTHQVLARHLRVLAAIGLRREGKVFEYHGRRFEVTIRSYRGFQDSPFRDGTKTNSEAKIRNLTNNTSLEYSLLVPDMIERYGFYEGPGTPYRVDPEAIFALLDFLDGDCL